MALTFIVTNAGRAALVNAANTGTAPVVIAQVGISATALVPTPATAALPGEFKRLITLSGDVVADDTIHLIVRDESSDVFTVRSIALYLGDGTLFGVYGQAPVLVEKSAQAMMLLGIDVRFEDIAATNITFGDANFLNPPATTEQIGVVELATVAEAQAGIDALRSLTPAAAKAAVLGWLLAQDGAGSGLDADLLDGQDGSYYSNIPARLGYSPVQQGTGLGQGTNTIKIGWSGTRLKATVDMADMGNIATDSWLASGGLSITGYTMYRGSYSLWGPDNDGAGSGLDADLLDGQDGSYYSNITARLGYTPANRAGDTFTGAIKRDTAYYLDISSGNPMVNWDASDYFLYDRANNNLHLIIGGQTRASFTSDGWLGLQTGFSANGSLVWHGGNDGAGSGLDADLLDGSDGSYYTNIPARLGYTPVQQGGGAGQGGNKVYIGWSGTYMKMQVDTVDLGYIITNGLLNGGTFPIHGATVGRAGYALWGPDNDGAGSGLDADLLDGQDGSYYSNITARLGYSPVNKAGDTMSGALTLPTLVVAGAAGTNGLSGGTGDGASYSLYNLTMNIWWGLGIKTYDGSVNGFYDARTGRWDVKAGYRVNGVDVWHGANDGSGSGLDADLLDGLQASDFVKYVNFTKATNYEILPDGRIIQWGFADALPTRTTTTITFPIAFPNGALQMLASLGTALTLTDNRVGCGAAPISNTQGNIALPANFGGTIGVTWLAIGH
jgi:hypothetical protein